MVATLFYWFSWSVYKLWFTLYNRMRIRGLRRIPTDRPVILVSNHASNIDPLMLATCFWQRLNYMAKAELFEKRWRKWCLEQYGAYPVNRGEAGDRKAMVHTLRLLRENRAVLLFPEGTRSRDGQLQPFKSGFARLALSVPGTLVVPIRVRGTFESLGPGKSFPRPSRITVDVGEPFDPATLPGLPEDKKALYQAVSDVMFDRISGM
jgi:1-acyl-sn-glycerol-3-phosphate acyltransferase